MLWDHNGVLDDVKAGMMSNPVTQCRICYYKYALTTHCYKSWGLIPPAWLDDTILNLQANGIYFRHVCWVKTSSLLDFSDDIGRFRQYRTFPMISDISEKFSSPALQQNGTNTLCMLWTHSQVIWTRSSRTICCASTSVLLVLLGFNLKLFIMSVMKRLILCWICSLSQQLCEDMEIGVGLSECLWISEWCMNVSTV